LENRHCKKTCPVRRLPIVIACPTSARASRTYFSIAGHEGYLTVGLYPNGQPGEIFIRMAKEGSTIAGLMECFGTVVSVSLQHGVPLKVLCDKLSHTRFDPSG
jgi:ribonucleoside-diphosphate reductase alpha chain